MATWIVANHCFSISGDSHSDLCETPESVWVTLLPPILRDLCCQDCFIDGFSWIADVPQTHQEILLVVEGLWRSLTQQYQKIQSMLPRSINLDTSDNMIYKVFENTFKSLELSPNYTLISIPQLHAEITYSNRKREDLTTKGSGVMFIIYKYQKIALQSFVLTLHAWPDIWYMSVIKTYCVCESTRHSASLY